MRLSQSYYIEDMDGSALMVDCVCLKSTIVPLHKPCRQHQKISREAGGELNDVLEAFAAIGCV